MKRRITSWNLPLALLLVASLGAAWSPGPARAAANEPPIAGSQPADPAQLARGEYLLRVAGCHDCHTPGHAQSAGNVPREQWLTGDATAWEGPWGTSFASNLRLSMARFNDRQWLDFVQALNTRPPMPWFNLRAMSDEDLLAILRFVQWLGPKGEPAPTALAPGEPYYGMVIRQQMVNWPETP